MRTIRQLTVIASRKSTQEEEEKEYLLQCLEVIAKNLQANRKYKISFVKIH